MKDADRGFSEFVIFRAQIENIVKHETQIEIQRDRRRAVRSLQSQLKLGWKFTAAEIGLIETFSLTGATDELRIHCV